MTARAPGTAELQPEWQPAGRAAAWRTLTVAVLLAGLAIAWTAYPLHEGRAGTKITLTAAIVSGVLSITQLLFAGIPPRPSTGLTSLAERTADGLLSIIRAAPWAEVMLVALLGLEALHRARPWHTGVLGVALLGYLLAVHLTETRARPGVLRAQLPLLAAGIGLAALAVGAAALPVQPAGPSATTIRVIAVCAAVVAAALVIPAVRQED
jgi:hypothetical protein